MRFRHLTLAFSLPLVLIFFLLYVFPTYAHGSRDKNTFDALGNSPIGVVTKRVVQSLSNNDNHPDSLIPPATPHLQTSAVDRIVLNATVRDFHVYPAHPDFQPPTATFGVVTGLVATTLGTDNKPVLLAPYPRGNIQGPSSFNQWYNDVPGVNLQKTIQLELRETNATSGIFRYDNQAFFPINGQLFGNELPAYPNQNFHFTMELHTKFVYQGGESLTFRGDDDVWLFINNNLVIDLGGIHSSQQRTINLDTISNTIGITTGGEYKFDMFYAERYPCCSTLRLETTIQFQSNLPPDQAYSQGECPFCSNADVNYFAGPINTSSGNYNHSTADLSVGTLGQPLSFERSYNSMPITGGAIYSMPLGYGWTHNFNSKIVLPNQPGGELGTVILQGPRGSRMRFRDDGGGNYTAYAGIDSTLRRTGTTGAYVYTVTTASNVQYVFNTTGLLTKQRDPQGNLRQLTYTSGKLTQVLDPNTGQALAFTYNGQGRIATVSDGNRTVEYAYTGNDLTEVEDTRNLTWTYAYTNHRLFEIKDPEQILLEQVTYDSFGRAERIEDGEGSTLFEVDYIPSGTGFSPDSTRVVTESGTVLTVTYNASNLLDTVEYANGQVTDYAHDSDFNVQQYVDGNNNLTRFQYNEYGLPRVITDALGYTTTYIYDTRNNLLTLTNARGFTTTFEYDSKNNLREMTDALGYRTVYTYTTLGQLKEVKDPLTRLTKYKYNSLGLPEVLTDALGYATTFQYDNLGRVITATDAFGKITVNDYDETGHLLSVTENYTTAGGQNYLNTYNLITTHQYDDAGRKTESIDTLGMVTKHEYDDAGHLVTVTSNYTSNVLAEPDTFNLVTIYNYDAYGRQTLVTDPLGHISFTGYDENGRVACTIENYVGTSECNTVYNSMSGTDVNLITLYGYDDTGNQNYLTDTLGRVTFTEYDALNRPLTVTINYVNGVYDTAKPDEDIITEYQYDAVGNQTHMTDTLGRYTLTEYDKVDRSIEVTVNVSSTAPSTVTDVNITSVYTYNAVGNRTHTLDSKGRITFTEYDNLNRPLTVTLNYVDGIYNPAFPDTDVINSQYSYDRVGNTVYMTDAEGRVTFHQYDALYRLTESTRNYTPTATTSDANITTNYTYNPRGNKLTSTDALGRITKHEYDLLGRMITITQNVTTATGNDANIITVYDYDKLGRRERVQDGEGRWTTYEYDDVGRTVAVANALYHTTTYSYDGVGNRLTVTNPEAETVAYAYDDLNRLITTTLPLARVTVNVYDGIGNWVGVIDGNGVRTCYGYDKLDRLNRVTENCVQGQGSTVEQNVITRYFYDKISNRTAIVNARSYTTTFGYDGLDRLITESDPLNHVTTYGYDRIGNRITMNDAMNVTTLYAYDGVNRLAAINYPAPMADVAFTYDKLGNRLTMVDSTGTTTYQYDGVNRLIENTDGTAVTVGYDYDKVGNRTQLVQPGQTINYAYDAGYRLATAQISTDGTYTYTYDSANRLTTLAYPNNVASLYEYDDTGWLLTLTHSTTTDLLGQYEYRYDEVGNRTYSTETHSYPGTAIIDTQRITYTYDNLYRLREADYDAGEEYRYGYDATGNRVTMTTPAGNTAYVYDAANRLTSVNGTPYSYDNNGNLLSDGAAAYAYDAANRLITATLGTTVSTYTYDGIGNRVAQTVNSAITRYALDVGSGLYEVIAATTGGNATRYVQVNGQILARNSGLWGYVLPDHLGSVRQIADATGDVAFLQHYEPFGSVKDTYGTSSSEFGFTGEQEDVTGLVFLRARYYAPRMGRFLRRDLFAGYLKNPYSLHAYQYGYSNPISFTDPSGYAPPQDAPCEPNPIFPDPSCVPFTQPTPSPTTEPQMYGPLLSTIEDPLSSERWGLIHQEAGRLGVPVELLAATIATEIVHDTDSVNFIYDTWVGTWGGLADFAYVTRDRPLFDFCYDMLECAHEYCGWATYGNIEKEGYGYGAAPGVAHMHAQPAIRTENYFNEYYPGQNLLPTLDVNNRPGVRMRVLLSDEGSIRYAAAYLRQYADIRKGSKTDHTNDLNNTDMIIIYTGYRCGFWCYSNDKDDTGEITYRSTQVPTPNPTAGANEFGLFLVYYQDLLRMTHDIYP